jgi:methionyl-tRNA formyltransferase
MSTSPSPATYVYATAKPWNLEAFAAARSQLPGEWVVVTTPADLAAVLARVSPRYVFFPHWSDIVPADVVERFECVCFHMTDVPYGRGGSPLQNLIERGHVETRLTALRMTDVLDAGPVYLKRPLALDGSAAEIFVRAAKTICEMMGEIVVSEPRPTPQQGGPVPFARRKPEQSRLPPVAEPERLYDHIRMLDAPGYPTAFLEEGPWRLEFDGAQLADGVVEARVRITPREDSA